MKACQCADPEHFPGSCDRLAPEDEPDGICDECSMGNHGEG